MKNSTLFFALVIGLVFECSQSPASELGSGIEPPKTRSVDVAATEEQLAEIRALVEQLVFADGEATNEPIMGPGLVVRNAQGNSIGEVPPSPGYHKDAKEYKKRYEACEDAFQKLYEFKSLAFPILVEHLDDKRQSIHFRNHYTGNSVGDACRWNIYYQLQDRPKNYSKYGHGRTGRDGKTHTKPYWEDTPFGDAGGVKEWLVQNKDLTYPEMQVKCLQWLLTREKEIGACDAESYFLNILPLEIRILERKQESGEDVAGELDKLRKVLKNKEVEEIPAELLPAR